MIVLASASPRRSTLLAAAGVAFEVVPSRSPERSPAPGEDARNYAVSLAVDKANEVAAGFADMTVLAADTVVSIDGRILGKPREATEAKHMLSLLRGREHLVVTGVAVRRADSVLSDARTAVVLMRAVSDEEIDRYASSGEPLDKAGAYAVQGLGGRLVERVTGCFNAVVGLPLCTVASLLRLSGSGETISSAYRCDHRG